MTMHINFNEKQCQSIADLLIPMAKAYFVLQTKTLGFHWNVVGPNFVQLHHFFEETQVELSQCLDEVSERMRAVGFWAPKSVSELTSNAMISDIDYVPAPIKMIEILINDFDVIVRKISETLASLNVLSDESSVDLLVNHSRAFEKRLWMLRSLFCK